MPLPLGQDARLYGSPEGRRYGGGGVPPSGFRASPLISGMRKEANVRHPLAFISEDERSFLCFEMSPGPSLAISILIFLQFLRFP